MIMRQSANWMPIFFLLFPLLPTNGSAEDVIKQPGKRIVGGTPTTIDMHPWQVAFSVKLGGKDYLCGGSIISKRWVLSAAHCFAPARKLGMVRIKSGVTKYLVEGSWSAAAKVIVHPKYDGKTSANDIALVKLSTDAQGKSVPLVGRKRKLQAGQELEVTGWGATREGGSASARLLRAGVPYVSNSTCNEPTSYNGKIGGTMMCAGRKSGGIDACQGDSGGPLIWRTDDGPVLVGVVSWGDGCARKLKYGVYTRVSKFRSWITKTVLANNK